MPNVGGLAAAIALVAFGTTMLIAHRQIATWWSRFYGRPVPTGLTYFYLRIAGPILIIAFGILALITTMISSR